MGSASAMRVSSQLPQKAQAGSWYHKPPRPRGQDSWFWLLQRTCGDPNLGHVTPSQTRLQAEENTPRKLGGSGPIAMATAMGRVWRSSGFPKEASHGTPGQLPQTLITPHWLVLTATTVTKTPVHKSGHHSIISPELQPGAHPGAQHRGDATTQPPPAVGFCRAHLGSMGL